MTAASHSDESRAFLQGRVERYWLGMAAFHGFFLVYQGALALAVGYFALEASLALTALAVVICLGTWLLASRGPRSSAFLRVLEVSSFLGISSVYVVLLSMASAVGKPDLTTTLGLTLALIGRCIYVPSSARLTLVLASMVAVPLLATTYVVYHRVTPEALEVLHGIYHDLMHEQRHTGMDPDAFARASTLYTAVWWAACGAACVATSHVVHGLRSEVRNIRRLGQYVLEAKLGEGGMGIVYRAAHSLLRRPTAIKLLPPERAGAANVLRFEREVRRTASLTHPNTVTVFDYGRTPDGVFYYAMELLEGATLEEVVAVGGRQPESRVVHVLAAAAAALNEAHHLGLIHRDIKPQNIMLCERGRIPDVVKVLDFGLVKELDKADAAALSGQGGLAGTPLYMSPEAITAPERVDARSDIYALGAVGYYLLTGENVFHGKTLVEICAHHLHSEPVAPSVRIGGPVSPALERLLLDCLSKDPSRRPASAEELEHRLACCDVKAWSTSEARDWWEEHGGVLRERRRGPAAEEERTLTVDLAERGEAPSRAQRVASML